MKRALLAPTLATVALLAGCGSPSSQTASTPTVSTPAPPPSTSPTPTEPSAKIPPSPAGSSRAAHHPRPRRPAAHRAHAHAARWQDGALATARTFVDWFDRWLAGETTARQAPDVTPAYGVKLRATVNSVPPAAHCHAAAIVHLIPAAVPPKAAHPHEAWIYTATRSQGAVIQFTVEERLYGGRWHVYDLYQGP